MERTLDEAKQNYVSNFEIIEGKIIHKTDKRKITLDDIKAAYFAGFEFARISSEPTKSVIVGFMDAPAPKSKKRKPKKKKHEPLSPDKYSVYVYGAAAESEGQIPHIHVIIPEKLNVAYSISDNTILDIIEDEDGIAESLIKEVAEWFDLPHAYFATNRSFCLYLYDLYNCAKPLVHKPH